MAKQPDDSDRRSRRAVLIAAAGGVAAASAAALGRPGRAFAADGDALLLGADNHAGSLTALHRDGITEPNQATFFADTTISAAIVGHGTTGQGVIGRSVDGAGVQGYSETDAGLNGFGVYGLWADAAAFGVFAKSQEGTALHGETQSGYALSTSGRVHLHKASGVATIAAGTTSKVVSPGTDVNASTFVLLTPRGNLKGRDLWYTVDTAANTIRIRISKAMAAPLRVGWLKVD